MGNSPILFRPAVDWPMVVIEGLLPESRTGGSGWSTRLRAGQLVLRARRYTYSDHVNTVLEAGGRVTGAHSTLY